jgi:FKBP-type peptidyl-prolyl cis-trans isomerase FkpA
MTSMNLLSAGRVGRYEFGFGRLLSQVSTANFNRFGYAAALLTQRIRATKELLMARLSQRALAALACFILIGGSALATQDGGDVEFPKLPKGAGKIDAEASKKFTTTQSGLKYRVLRKGSDKMPKATDKVEVHYHGWLDSGKVFDSSYERGQTIAFGLNQVIKGWTEGMQLVGEGGMIELEIPSDLGYGARGAGGVIPGNATLHFLV